MIIIADDEIIVLDTVKTILSADGHSVAGFETAREALAYAEKERPELVISDIIMPEMGGFEFKKEYERRFPNAATPFIFLSSAADSDTIVKGLDLGADDYLTKPIDPAVLKARVRAILRRKKIYSTPVFRGDLSKLPFVSLLQFCEMKGLNGEVAVSSGDIDLRIPFRGGNLMIEQIDDSQLEKLYESTEGTFTILSRPVDFGEIESSSFQLPKASPASLPDGEKPMGRLSGVKAENKLFQIQTEFVNSPETQVVTIVVLDGKVLTKKIRPVDVSASSRAQIEQIIDDQHKSVERETGSKISELLEKKSTSPPAGREKFTELFEKGFEKYREGDYAAAFKIWEDAHSINPADKITETNLKMLRKKLKI